MPLLPNPTAPWQFFWRNPKRTVPLIGMLMLAVFLMNIVVVYMGSFEATSLAHNSLVQRFTLVLPKQSLQLPSGMAEDIQDLSAVSWVAPAFALTTHVPQAAGYTSFTILGLADSDMLQTLQAADVEVAAGRLPAAGAPEVALDGCLARPRRPGGGVVRIPDRN